MLPFYMKVSFKYRHRVRRTTYGVDADDNAVLVVGLLDSSGDTSDGSASTGPSDKNVDFARGWVLGG